MVMITTGVKSLNNDHRSRTGLRKKNVVNSGTKERRIVVFLRAFLKM